MAEMRDFAASNKPDTCLWCGRKLVHKAKLHWSSPVADPVKVGRNEKGGAYSDGSFCGLTCGYLFGVAMADNGRRLQPKEEKSCPST